MCQMSFFFGRYVLTRHNGRFAREYKQEPAEIPQEWTTITLEKAVSSLNEFFPEGWAIHFCFVFLCQEIDSIYYWSRIWIVINCNGIVFPLAFTFFKRNFTPVNDVNAFTSWPFLSLCDNKGTMHSDGKTFPDTLEISHTLESFFLYLAWMCGKGQYFAEAFSFALEWTAQRSVWVCG